jgi:hypothetical protein
MKRLAVTSTFVLRIVAGSFFIGGVSSGVAALAGPASPAYACTYAAASVDVWAWTPILSRPNVNDNGGVNSFPSPPCGMVQQTRWETKVCGTFGCNWQTWAQTQTRAPTSNSYSQWAVASCRRGLNRYRTESDAYNVGGPGYTLNRFSSEPQYSC